MPTPLTRPWSPVAPMPARYCAGPASHRCSASPTRTATAWNSCSSRHKTGACRSIFSFSDQNAHPLELVLSDLQLLRPARPPPGTRAARSSASPTRTDGSVLRNCTVRRPAKGHSTQSWRDRRAAAHLSRLPSAQCPSSYLFARPKSVKSRAAESQKRHNCHPTPAWAARVVAHRAGRRGRRVSSTVRRPVRQRARVA